MFSKMDCHLVASTPADAWDLDGDFDLLAGTVDRSEDGNVYLIRNNGTAKKNRFEDPQKLLASERPIVARHGDAAPIAADWDDDGLIDLVLGCGDGSVVWFRNEGTKLVPAFSEVQTLVPAPSLDSQRGTRAKPCVVDWNGDGTLDLLIGDFGKSFDKVLSEEEQQWRTAAKQQQDSFMKSWATTFSQYRQLVADSVATKPVGDEVQSEIERLRADLVNLNKVRSRYREQQQALQPGKQYHGRIWICLRGSTRGQATTERSIANVSPPMIDKPTPYRPVTLDADIRPSIVAPNSDVALTIRMSIADGWHVYAVDSTDKNRIATRIDLQLPVGMKAKGEWKIAQSQEIDDEGNVSQYDHDVTFRKILSVLPDAGQGILKVECQISFQACNESLCLPVTTKVICATVNLVDR